MDKNKLQNMDHQELTNAGQRPEDQQYDQNRERTGSQPKSGLEDSQDRIGDIDEATNHPQ